MGTLADAFIRIRPDMSHFSSEVEGGAKSAGLLAGEHFAGAMTGAMRSLAGLATGIIGGLAVKDFLKESIVEAQEAARVGRLTEAVLLSTGSAARISAGDVEKLAHTLSLKSGIDHETIQSGENVLLTFTRIRNEVGKGNDIFTQAASLTLDLSVALKQDYQSSLIQVGKALNDPIKGMTSLIRVGVSFTEQQKEQIRNFVASGDIMSAQKVILKELATEFGGAAAAAADPAMKMKVAWKEFHELIGQFILPLIGVLASAFTTHLVPVLQERVVPAIGKMVDLLKIGFVDGSNASSGAVQQFGNALRDFATWLGAGVRAFRDGQAEGTGYTRVIQDIGVAVRAVFGWLRDVGIPVLRDVAHWMHEHQDIVIGVAAAYVAWKLVLIAHSVAIVAHNVYVGIANVLTIEHTGVLAVNNGVRLLSTTYLGTWLGVKALELGSWIASTVATTAGTVAVVAHTIATNIAAVATIAFTVVMRGLAVAMAFATGPIGAIIAIVALLVIGIIYAYQHSEAFRTIVNQVWRDIQTTVNQVVSWFTGTAWPAIKAFLTGVAATFTWLYENIVKPVFAAIAWWINFEWTLIQIPLKLMEIAITALGLGVLWLYDHAIKPAWAATAAWITEKWTAIRAVLDGAATFIGGLFSESWRALANTTVAVWNRIAAGVASWWSDVSAKFWVVIGFVRGIFTQIWNDLAGSATGAWNRLGAGLSAGWDHIRSAIFEPLRNFVTVSIPSAFNVCVDAVGRAWDRIKDVAKQPVHFVLDTVLNNGIIAGVNWLARLVGVHELSKIPMPFAEGGIFPGYTPGRDIGLAAVSGGEAIMRPEWTDAVGPEFVHTGNLLARTGGARAVRDWLRANFAAVGGDMSSPLSGYLTSATPAGRAPLWAGGFVDGGIIGVIKSAWDAFTDPIGTLKKTASALLGGVPGAGAFKDLAVGGGKTALKSVGDWLDRSVGGLFGGPGGVPANVASAQAFIRAQGGKPYIWDSAGPGGYDCSGFVSAVWNILHGKNPYSHTFSTGNEAGFFPLPGHGVFTAGWANPGEKGGGRVGHTTGNLAGLAFEAGGALGGTHYGPGSTSVDSFAHVGHYASGGILKDVIRNLGSMDSGGWAPPGWNLFHNGLGVPEKIGSGALVHIEHAQFNDPVDVDMLGHRLDFAAATYGFGTYTAGTGG